MKKLLTFKEVAGHFGWTTAKLAGMVDRGHFPVPFKIGCKKYYTPLMVDGFVDQLEASTIGVGSAAAITGRKRAGSVYRSQFRDLLPEEDRSRTRKNLPISQGTGTKKSNSEDGHGVISMALFKREGLRSQDK